MSATRPAGLGRDQRALNAYYDGELGGLRRWLFERRLAHSPQLRAELEELERVSRWVQQLDAEPSEVDLWHGIALRLPELDAERRERTQKRVGSKRGRGTPRGGRAEPWSPREPGWLAAHARPIAVVAVGAALALALFLGIMRDAAPPMPGMIRWLDSGGRSVMVLEDQGDATIVWLLDAPDEGTSTGGSREAV
jgi:anti-sigma factor RsiW